MDAASLNRLQRRLYGARMANVERKWVPSPSWLPSDPCHCWQKQGFVCFSRRPLNRSPLGLGVGEIVTSGSMREVIDLVTGYPSITKQAIK